MRALGERGRQVRFILEAVLHRHLPEALGERRDFDAVDFRDVGDVENPDHSSE